MMIQAFQRFALAVSAAVLLTGCALSQPAIGTPGAVSQNQTLAARSDSSNYKVLHRFHGRTSDGSHPVASLLDVNGVLYGTTIEGGTARGGTVFTITTSGAEQILYGFHREPDGAYPLAGLIDVNGTLYGTTSHGGDRRGTVFSLSTGGAEQILYKFPKRNLPGSYPDASLLEMNGIFYGTTVSGGASSGCFQGCGTVYRITKSGAETVLHSFGSGTDGRGPQAALIDVHGTLYGTTAGGGTYNKGTVFSITTSGSEKVLYNFTGGTDGGSPVAGVINVNGTLYGTTTQGGNVSCNCGVIYSITSGAEKVLYSFQGGSDGNAPHAKLLRVKRILYGTTEYGGDKECGSPSRCGTVFALSL